MAGMAVFSLSACSQGVLAPLGPVGEGDATIFIDALVIMLAIVLPTIAMAFWIAWRYRSSNSKADYRPEWAFSGRIEAVVWSIPILTIMVLGGLIWIGSIRLDPFRPLPARKPPLEIEVISLDWKWLFIYPQQHIAVVNELVIPVGQPVHFSITSASVFNSFFVPRLGSMIYAMPGMVSQLHLQADHPAMLWGASTQFSGEGFSDMHFTVRSLAGNDFDAWARGATRLGPSLDRAAYASLLRPSSKVAPFSYRQVDPGLFQMVAKQTLPIPASQHQAASGPICGGSKP